MTTGEMATRNAAYTGGSTVTRLPAWLASRSTPDMGNSTRRGLTDAETTAVIMTGVATLLLGLIGLVNSFHSVAAAAESSFGRLAFTVPLAIDIGILVFSALDLVLAKLDMRIVWLRLLPWSLVAVTIYLNVEAESTWFGRIAHAVLPGLWVVAVEVGTYAVRRWVGLGSPSRMDRIRCSRWLLAPLPTALLWRRMVLWEIRSYPDALARERDRLLAKTRLQDTYGWLGWRWQASRRERALYRLGELAPDATTAVVTAPAPVTVPARSEPTRKSTRRTGRKTARSRRTNKPDVTELVPAARTAAARIADRGEDLNRKTLAAQLRTDGQQVGNAKLGALLEHLRSKEANK
ncbi:DUF2637 domain-containing protein [Actinopolymorpha sp. B17G11]|uniref:DUF2637 domain-containing protein n=1 Tax=Actinopolymorpha sp. B17G11 TaxID=3160861 RepID=UPI0032E465C5